MFCVLLIQLPCAIQCFQFVMHKPKQLLIKCYLKHYRPLPDFASQTTLEQITRLHQNKLLDYTRTSYVVCVYYKHDKLAFFVLFCILLPVISEQLKFSVLGAFPGISQLVEC